MTLWPDQLGWPELRVLKFGMPLTKEQIQSFEKKLLAAKSDIESGLKKLKEGLDFGSDIDHFEEETDETEEFANYLSVKKPLEEKLGDIETALERIKGGAYGRCDKCNRDIEIEVLEAAPRSTLCKKCKGLL